MKIKINTAIVVTTKFNTIARVIAVTPNGLESENIGEVINNEQVYTNN